MKSRKSAPRSIRRAHHHPLPWLLFVLVVIGLINYLRPLPALGLSTIAEPAPPAQTQTVTWPADSVAAVGAVGFGTLASSTDLTSQKPLPTASIAKLITTLTVLKQAPLSLGQQGPTLTLTDADVAFYNQYHAEDGSVVSVVAGEQISEYQVLQAMLLPSANNMADTLAVWQFGSLANYSIAANQFVANAGLTHTTVGVDASGFSPTTTSTPSDLITLGTLALANPVIASIVSQHSAVIPVAGTVTNVNILLGRDGINGLKTGNSDQAGGCILFSSDYQVAVGKTVTIVGAIMGAPSLGKVLAEVQPLLDSTKADFSVKNVVAQGQRFARVTIPWSKNAVSVTAQSSIATIAWQNKTDPLHVSLNKGSLHAPLAAQSVVGSITYNSAVAPVSLVTSQAIGKPSLWWRLFRT